MYAILLIIFIIVIFVASQCNTRETFFYISPSKIHGTGIFSKGDIEKNEVLFEAINENQNISYLGSLVNHCTNATSRLIKKNNKWFLISLKKLKKNEEITADYNHTPYFIKKPDPTWKC